MLSNMWDGRLRTARNTHACSMHACMPCLACFHGGACYYMLCAWHGMCLVSWCRRKKVHMARARSFVFSFTFATPHIASDVRLQSMLPSCDECHGSTDDRVVVISHVATLDQHRQNAQNSASSRSSHFMKFKFNFCRKQATADGALLR